MSLDDDILTIAATRDEEHDENTTNYHVKVRCVVDRLGGFFEVTSD